ncbi:MAG: ATP citrate lyase [Nitrospinae bacterium]|nr:ATP citrate lyase [Nitrospinota bacterium]
MAKVLEGPGMDLLSKWGMNVPRHVVVTSVDQAEHLVDANPWLCKGKTVVKAHEAIGSRFKLGLVKINLDCMEAEKAIREMIGKNINGLIISQVIIEEMISHEKEYYIAVKSTREGADILLASIGGIEVEANWDQVKRLSVGIGENPERSDLEILAKEGGFSDELIPKIADFAFKLYQCYDQEDGTYIEINPLIIRPSDRELVALDIVTLLDGDARFRHPEWNFNFASEFGRPYTEDEKAIMEIDSRVKGSVKFIEIIGGDTALLPAGGGASVFYSDAVVEVGGNPANYAEYSGDPPEWAVEALTDKVCSLPGIKRIIVGGAIANFTDVKVTFQGIINGFRKAKEDGKLDGVEIWVRRGGPNEKEGLSAMRALKDEGFNIHVFDRYTPMTDIVDLSLKKRES